MPCRSKLLPPRAAASVHRGSSALARSVAETSDDMSSTCLSTNDSLGTSGFRFRTWGKVTNRSGPIDSEPAHGASLYGASLALCDTRVQQASPQAGRPRASGTRRVGHRFWLTDSTVPLGKTKPTGQMSVRTQPGPRFRTCCATTTADKNVVEGPKDLILGAEHDRNSKARDLSWDRTAALQGGRDSSISISISISKQSSNQNHHRTLVAGLA